MKPKVNMYKVVFSSGYTVRTFEYETKINEVVERLRQRYAQYYNVSHTIQEIICESK